ncbi:MAG: hypothetical protein Q7J32_02355 [Sphingomonadaceae bacterium]|nr:hypothetical protein [Sphingomonadaceae bacterium]
MADQDVKVGFGEKLDLSDLGGWLVGAFRPGGTKKKGVELNGTSELTKGLKIIDVDTHLSERGDLWTARLPAALKSKGPYVKRVGHLDYWHIGEDAISPAGVSVID